MQFFSSGASNSDVEAIMTGETATFMGKRYAREQFTVTQRQQPTELTYRGFATPVKTALRQRQSL